MVGYIILSICLICMILHAIVACGKTKDLESENQVLKDRCHNATNSVITANKEVEILKQENEQLKQENVSLKAEKQVASKTKAKVVEDLPKVEKVAKPRGRKKKNV